MTLTLKVFFYTTRTDGVPVKQAEAEVSGTTYSDVISQCDAVVAATDWRYMFTWS
jgi:hypothetical protein